MKKLLKILNIISVCIYILATIITTYLLIRYMTGDKTEGSGIDIFVLIVINTIECLIVILLNLVGIILLNKEKLLYNDNKKSYNNQLLWLILMIVVPIVTFVIQMVIV